MTTMLEKAARASAHAMHAFYNGDADSSLVWASLSEEAQESFKAQARAALQAIREPSPDMISRCCWGGQEVVEWTSGIDEILLEGKA